MYRCTENTISIIEVNPIEKEKIQNNTCQGMSLKEADGFYSGLGLHSLLLPTCTRQLHT